MSEELEMGEIYDGVEKAMKTWGLQTKEFILLEIMCFYVVTAKHENIDVRSHPLVENITRILRRAGLKTQEEIMDGKGGQGR